MAHANATEKTCESCGQRISRRGFSSHRDSPACHDARRRRDADRIAEKAKRDRGPHLADVVRAIEVGRIGGGIAEVSEEELSVLVTGRSRKARALDLQIWQAELDRGHARVVGALKARKAGEG
jgi:hypothetical protein